MTSIENMHQSVQQAVANKRLGTPVFVRYSIQSQEKATAVLARLARMTETVSEWFGQSIARIYALGTPADGQVTLTVEFNQGATALISWASNPPRGDGVDLMLIGNRGALYHDAGAAYLWDQAAAPTTAEPNKDILARIDRAVRSGQPE